MTVPQEIAGINEPRARAGDAEKDPRPSAVNFVTTEHFALQSARAATIAESTGRATMFLTSASGGLIALGLVATATGVGTAFYAFGLVLLPTLAFVGLVTFERAVQIGLEDYLLMSRPPTGPLTCCATRPRRRTTSGLNVTRERSYRSNR